MFGWSDVQTRQNTVRLLVILAVILSILGFICGMALAVKSSGFMFVVCLIPAGILWWRFYVNLKSYKEMYKELVVKKAAEGMFDNFQYSPKVGFDREEIRETGIMNMGNRYNSEDMVDGSYKGVTFRRADMYIAEHHQSGKNSYTIVFLRGTWLSFTYNKRFLTDVQIMSNDFHHGNKKTSRFFVSEEDRRHKFETEDMTFNRLFTCTCQNDAEAFYLLTPRVMQMLQLLKSEFGCPYMVGFVNNRLHFAINSGKNNMEPPIMEGISYEREVEKTRRELKIIANIIDSLAIDRDIFIQ